MRIRALALSIALTPTPAIAQPATPAEAVARRSSEEWRSLLLQIGVPPVSRFASFLQGPAASTHARVKCSLRDLAR